MAMDGSPASAVRAKARGFLEKAAKLGDLQARYLLATYEFQKNGFSRKVVDPQALEQLAEQGHEGAIQFLFVHFRMKDETKAAKYLKQGLKLEIPGVLVWQAFANLAEQDFETRNTRAENLHALHSYRRAAARGDRSAIFEYANEIPYVYRMLGRILTDWEPLQGKEAYKIRAYACYLRYQELAPEPREGLFEERTRPLALTPPRSPRPGSWRTKAIRPKRDSRFGSREMVPTLPITWLAMP